MSAIAVGYFRIIDGGISEGRRVDVYFLPPCHLDITDFVEVSVRGKAYDYLVSEDPRVFVAALPSVVLKEIGIVGLGMYSWFS